MSTRIIMVTSALAMAIAGLAASFMPHEVLRLAGEASTGMLRLVVQLMGALYLGFAVVNWIAKDSLIGGIYNRPVAVGNFVHFLAGALALVRAAVATPFNNTVVITTIVYAILAIAFAYVFFRSPLKRADV